MSSPDLHDQTYSLWHATQTTEDEPPPLDGKHTVDACIIGAGIAGLATAYQLVSDGLKVAVLDNGTIGGGETGRSTAHLSCAIDDRFYRIEELHGEEGARIAYESHASGIQWFDRITAREGIDCELQRVDGFLFLPPGEKEELLRREETAARRAGVDGLRYLPRAPLPSFET